MTAARRAKLLSTKTFSRKRPEETGIKTENLPGEKSPGRLAEDLLITKDLHLPEISPEPPRRLLSPLLAVGLLGVYSLSLLSPPFP
jgi:hypothetical protein